MIPPATSGVEQLGDNNVDTGVKHRSRERGYYNNNISILTSLQEVTTVNSYGGLKKPRIPPALQIVARL